MKLWICGFLFSTISLCASILFEDSIVKVHSIIKEYDCHAPWAPPKTAKYTGSGCIIEGNRILTVAHLLTEDAIVEVQAGSSNKRFRAHVKKVGFDCDLAILEVEDMRFFKGKTPLIVSKQIAKEREEVEIYGFPHGGPLFHARGNILTNEMSLYQHSYTFLLTSQIENVTIYPGNSGGPVMLRGKVVGIIHERIRYVKGRVKGFMIPVPIVQHFLQEALSAGQYQGFPGFPVEFQIVCNPSMRAHLGLCENEGGLLITHVPSNYWGCNVLQQGDILTEIDGRTIDCSGYVDCPELSLQLPVDYVITKKFFGETIKFSVLRNGRKVHLNAHINPMWRGLFLVNLHQHKTDPPTYYILAGLVLQPLTRSMLEGNLEELSIVLSSVNLYNYFLKGYVEGKRDELVVITHVLEDPINVGYQNIRNEVVKEVNGHAIHNMSHMIDVLSKCNDPYYVIKTEDKSVIIFNRKEALKHTPTILRCYSIPYGCSKDLMIKDIQNIPIANEASIYTCRQ